MPAKPHTSSKIIYLVWDADGTLFDSYPAIVQALLDAMWTFGAEPYFPWLEKQARQSLGTTYRMLSEMYHVEEERILAQYRQAWLQIPLETQPVFPFVKEVCSYVLDQGGQNFVLTHRRRVSLERLMQYHAMQPYFTASITKDDGYPDKPDPQGLLAIMTKYSLPASQVMMIGDRELDIQAGKNAGVHNCLYGTNSLQEPADFHFTSYSDLLDLLKSQA